MKEYYRIGETASLMGITTQTLRFYDKIGLVKPIKIDPRTGYRYYAYEQFHFIDRIKYLQSLGMPLDDIKEVMAKLRHRDFPVLNKHGKYVGMVSRRNLLGIKRRQLCLVDHNEISQAVDNIESAEILEIIDHHRIGSLQTMAPVYFRNQPYGNDSVSGLSGKKSDD